MFHHFRCSIIILLFLLCVREGKASHSMGSDITYRCLGGNTYEVTLSFYRDCVGIPASLTADIDITSSCFPTFTRNIPQLPNTGIEISPICPSQISTCNGGLFTGIQEYIYRDTITLPGKCADWKFSYQLCCRNAAITNINTPASTEMYIYASLNNLAVSCNNSPTFSNRPVPFVCMGQLYCYNHGAYDIDGDSLAYTLITPYEFAGVQIQYNPPFSPVNPLSSSPQMTFNSQTGDICMTPTNLEVTVMAVLVNEYRNGVLIGTVERDIQVTVINCTNQVPAMSGINGTNSFAMTVCAGTQACFDLFSSDADVNQNTYVTWDYSIPGASFTALPGQRENATFCWTPSQSQISNIPYCFTVTVRDNNCPFFGSQVYSYCITVTGLNVNAGPDQFVGCNANVSLNATASGGSGSYTYNWNNGLSGPVIPAGPGTYVVTASDGRCTNSDTVNVNPGSLTPLAAFSTNYNCSGLTVQFLNQSTLVTGTIVSNTWDFGDGNGSSAVSPTHTYSAAGTYWITLIVQTGGGCIDTVRQSMVVTNSAPSAAFTSNNVCAGSPSNFTNQSTSASPIQTWTWDFGDGNGSSIPSPAHIYATPGNYIASLSVVNADGCSSSINHPVTVFGIPNANAGPDQAVCDGNSINLTGSGGTSYLWNPGAQTTAQITLTPSLALNYYLTVTDNNGCTDMDTVFVDVYPQPVVNAGTPRTICEGSNVQLRATNSGSTIGLNYLWSPGNQTGSLITVSPVVTTTYTLIATNTYGCSDTSTVTVFVNPLPVANAGPDQRICSGNSTILNATGGGSYLWTPVNQNSASINVNPVSSTIYTVRVTDGNGCSSTDLVSVTVDPLPTAAFSPPPSVCAQSTASFNNLSGISGGSIQSYQWNFGSQGSSSQINPSFIFSTSGIFPVSLLAISDQGCRDSITFPYQVYAMPGVSLNATHVGCNGGNDGSASVLISSGTSPFTINWSPSGGNNTLASNLSAGSYIVHVTDTNGCSISDTIQITEPDVLVSLSSLQNVSCFGFQNGSIDITSTGGTAPYSYSWTPAVSSGNMASGLDTGVYDIMIIDHHGCSNQVQIVVTEPDLLNSSMQSNPVICHGDTTGSASIQVLGGTQPYTYSWTGSVLNSSLLTGQAAGWQKVRVVDANGCILLDSVLIIQPDPLLLTTNSPDTICIGQSADLISTASGGIAPYRYYWSNGPSDSAQTVSPGSTSNYSIYILDQNNCPTGEQWITVPVYPPLSVQISDTTELCRGENSYVFAQGSGGNGGPYQYSWNSGLSGLRDFFVSPYNDTLLSVMVSDACGTPVVFASVPVYVHPVPEALFLPHQISGCVPVYAEFNNNSVLPPGSQFIWNLDDNTTSHEMNPVHVYEIPGRYDVSLEIVTDHSCSSSLLIREAVIVYPYPHAGFTQSHDEVSMFYPSIEFTDNSSGALNWFWDFGDGSAYSFEQNPVHEYADTGTYIVRQIVYGEGGCPDTIYSIVRIEQEFTIYVPNSFTPNGDGRNDSFIAKGIGWKSHEMWIMDRWGKEIYHASGLNHSWDGTFFGNGKFCQNDVYEYIIDVFDYKDKRHRVIGHVTLVR